MALPTENELATPALLRAARGAYALAIRAALADVGIDDLPRNGAFILTGIDSTGGPRTDLPADLGVTKQAVSNAIEALVVKGYLERSTDPEDRRRIALEVTDRGQTAVGAVRRGIEAVDAELRRRVAPEQLESMRAGLLALAAIKGERREAGTGRGRRARQFRRCFPMFSVGDMGAAAAHYRSLGSTTHTAPPGSRTFTSAMPTPCKPSGRRPTRMASFGRSKRRATGCARARTSTRMAT